MITFISLTCMFIMVLLSQCTQEGFPLDHPLLFSVSSSSYRVHASIDQALPLDAKTFDKVCISAHDCAPPKDGSVHVSFGWD